MHPEFGKRYSQIYVPFSLWKLFPEAGQCIEALTKSSWMISFIWKLFYQRLRLKFGWWYSNQTWTVGSSKGCSDFTEITCPLGVFGSKCFWLCCRWGHACFTNTIILCLLFICLACSKKIFFWYRYNATLYYSRIVQIKSFTGGPQYRLLPLHSQIPREDQRKVFEPVPEGVTKVCYTFVIPFLQCYREVALNVWTSARRHHRGLL